MKNNTICIPRRKRLRISRCDFGYRGSNNVNTSCVVGTLKTESFEQRVRLASYHTHATTNTPWPDGVLPHTISSPFVLPFELGRVGLSSFFRPDVFRRRNSPWEGETMLHAISWCGQVWGEDFVNGNGFEKKGVIITFIISYVNSHGKISVFYVFVSRRSRPVDGWPRYRWHSRRAHRQHSGRVQVLLRT